MIQFLVAKGGVGVLALASMLITQCPLGEFLGIAPSRITHSDLTVTAANEAPEAAEKRRLMEAAISKDNYARGANMSFKEIDELISKNQNDSYLLSLRSGMEFSAGKESSTTDEKLRAMAENVGGADGWKAQYFSSKSTGLYWAMQNSPPGPQQERARKKYCETVLSAFGAGGTSWRTGSGPGLPNRCPENGPDGT